MKSFSRSNLHIGDLQCYGCSHQVSGSKYPGAPSGESACTYCVRAWKHGYNQHPLDKDWYTTMDSMYGQCNVCDQEHAYLPGRHCSQCFGKVDLNKIRV
jgi:hypothetical protein